MNLKCPLISHFFSETRSLARSLALSLALSFALSPCLAFSPTAFRGFPLPSPRDTHRMLHFTPLRKSLCIIKMLPGNSPSVDIPFRVDDNAAMSDSSQQKPVPRRALRTPSYRAPRQQGHYSNVNHSDRRPRVSMNRWIIWAQSRLSLVFRHAFLYIFLWCCITVNSYGSGYNMDTLYPGQGLFRTPSLF